MSSALSFIELKVIIQVPAVHLPVESMTSIDQALGMARLLKVVVDVLVQALHGSPHEVRKNIPVLILSYNDI